MSIRVAKDLLGNYAMGEMMSPNLQKLSEDIYTYVNYEKLLTNAGEKGEYLKESKDFYEGSILRILSNLFTGKSTEDIQASLRRLEESDEE